jgi:hypothetical protein
LRNISPTLIELQIANRTQSAPKKSKTRQGSASNGSSDLKRTIDKKAPRRRSTSAAAKKKPAAKVKVVKTSKPMPVIEPSDEEIRLRAYFIAERRARLALAGDSNTDWLEAKRQLLSELSPR